MMEAKISTIAGIVTGGTTQVLTGNIGTAVLVALATGSAAYIGQQITKWAHHQFKKKK